MNILFIVCGEGLGHASRCLHLGHYIQQHGHTVHFAGYGKSYDFMDRHGCTNLHHTPREACLEGEDGFFSLKKTLLCSKWITFNMLFSFLSACRLIRKNSIDCVVCDTMFAGVLASRLNGVPVVFITNQNHFQRFPWEINPIWLLLNFMLRRYLHLAKAVIVPDFPEPNAVSEYNLIIPKRELHRYHFTGPFLDIDVTRYSFSRKTIFCSFGGEPYKLPMYQILRKIADRRPDLFFDVFYTGNDLPESSENFFSHGYVPNLYEHLAEARIAIVHGGLTTLHEALLFEKPVVIVMDKNHPEQQNNARKIVQMGAGVAIDGRKVTLENLEAQITKALEISPVKFYESHARIDGRRKACDIITATGRHRK